MGHLEEDVPYQVLAVGRHGRWWGGRSPASSTSVVGLQGYRWGGPSPASLTRGPARLCCAQVFAMGANRFRRGQRTFRRMQGTSGPLQKTGNDTNANDNVELALAA